MSVKRRFRRRIVRKVSFGLALLVLIAVRLWQDAQPPHPLEVLDAGEAVEVRHVIDGDTIRLVSGERVRLIGVDTPEIYFPDDPERPTQPWGKQATRFTKQFVTRGKVRLQFDKERKDRFERFLAYVWVGGEMLNEELVRAGLARARLRYPYSESMKRRFRSAEKEARRAKRGIWSPDRGAGDAKIRLP